MRMVEPPLDALWERLEAAIDRAPTDGDIRSHRLEIPAARRFRAVGRNVPEDFVAQERLAGLRLLTAPLVLERLRAAYDGRVVVFKGPEVGTHYPDPTLRAFGDIDVFVDDATEAQRALLAAGFVEVGDPSLYVDIHHLRPVAVDGLPLSVEVHSRPKWIEGIDPPATRVLLDAAVPGSSGVEGISGLPPEHHALLLAVHSWAHEPLRRIRDVLDIALVARSADRRAVAELAQAWRVERLWRTTIAAADALFTDGSRPLALRVWARNLDRARERTVFENHVQRWLSNFWVLGPEEAVSRLPAILVDEVSPDEGETWRAKLARSALAVRNVGRAKSQHDVQVDERRARAAASSQELARSQVDGAAEDRVEDGRQSRSE